MPTGMLVISQKHAWVCVGVQGLEQDVSEPWMGACDFAEEATPAAGMWMFSEGQPVFWHRSVSSCSYSDIQLWRIPTT